MYKNRWILTVAIGVLAWGLVPSTAEARRQYNPGLKRFMQRDTLAMQPSGGSGYQDGMTLYGYVRGHPVSGRDPIALATCNDLDLFGQGKKCGNAQGCAVCDGKGKVLACINPSKFPGHPLDADGSCRADYSGSLTVAQVKAYCICVHERRHKTNVEEEGAGCTSGAKGTKKCKGVGAGDPPQCCDKYWQVRSERNAWGAAARCVESYKNEHPDQAADLAELEREFGDSLTISQMQYDACRKTHPLCPPCK
jgi:hypothetical protein